MSRYFQLIKDNQFYSMPINITFVQQFKKLQKMKLKSILKITLILTFLVACKQDHNTVDDKKVVAFNYNVEQFADVKILRYQIPGWEKLTLKEQKLVYYLTQAGLSGRDIIWDQNYRYNLTIRKALENVYTNYTGDKESDDWKAFETYLKRIWFKIGRAHV